MATHSYSGINHQDLRDRFFLSDSYGSWAEIEATFWWNMFPNFAEIWVSYFDSEGEWVHGRDKRTMVLAQLGGSQQWVPLYRWLHMENGLEHMIINRTEDMEWVIEMNAALETEQETGVDELLEEPNYEVEDESQAENENIQEDIELQEAEQPAPLSLRIIIPIILLVAVASFVEGFAFRPYITNGHKSKS